MIKLAALAAGVGLLAWLVSYAGFLAQALPNGTGLSAKHLCSLHFVSGLPVERAKALYIDAFVQPLTSFLDVQVDAASATLTTTGFGLATSRARHRRGYGCTLVHGDGELGRGRGDAPPAILTALNENHRATHFDTGRLKRALDAAFLNENKRRNTLAVAVFHAGELVAERYAEGISQTTPLPGWSMTKSVTATLMGMLADQGLVDTQAPGALAEWRGTGDPRQAITIDQLLRMTSGLNLVEDHSGADVNSRMLFQESDGAAFSARQPLLYDVGSTYDYMSGNTVLAARIVLTHTGEDLEKSHTWIEENLFRPLTMHSAVLEPDQAGTFIGSSFMLASARDWAQLGLLYMNDGTYDGRRLLSEDWIDYVLAWTPQSGKSAYGAGFWLNQFGNGELRWPEVPADAFWMNGFQSQYVFVIPSEELVIVRLGASSTYPRVRELVSDVIAARV